MPDFARDQGIIPFEKDGEVAHLAPPACAQRALGVFRGVNGVGVTKDIEIHDVFYGGQYATNSNPVRLRAELAHGRFPSVLSHAVNSTKAISTRRTGIILVLLCGFVLND